MEEYYRIHTASIFLADLAIRIGLSPRVIMRKREASITFFARLKENCALLVGPLL